MSGNRKLFFQQNFPDGKKLKWEMMHGFLLRLKNLL